MLQDVMYDFLYFEWSEWSPCTRSCTRRRHRACSVGQWCDDTVLTEEKPCYVAGSSCRKRRKRVTTPATPPEEEVDLHNNTQFAVTGTTPSTPRTSTSAPISQ